MDILIEIIENAAKIITLKVIFIIVIGMKRRTKKLSLNKHNNNIAVTVKER